MTMVYQTSVEYKIKICFDRSGVSFFYLVGEGGMNYFALGSFWRFKMLVYSLICNSISVLQARYNSIPHVDTGGIR